MVVVRGPVDSPGEVLLSALNPDHPREAKQSVVSVELHLKVVLCPEVRLVESAVSVTVGGGGTNRSTLTVAQSKYPLSGHWVPYPSLALIQKLYVPGGLPKVKVSL